MARRKTRGKIQNAVYTARFTVESSSAAQYLDLSATASILNRRFYRQGLQWAVSGFTLIAPAGANGSIVMKKLPTNWIVSNSWEKGMRAWMKQQNAALDAADQQSVKGRFNDFKIFADEAHGETVAPHFLLPVDGDGDSFLAPEEWLHSEVVIPNYDGTVGNTKEFKLHMMGGDGTTKSLIQAYADSRAVPQNPDPSTPGTASVGLYTNMFNDGMNETEVMANAEFRNDELPYNQDKYPGSKNNGPGLELVDTLTFATATTQPGKFHMNGGTFPCGLVKINNSGSKVDLLVHLVPGSHRGYLAESMVDM